MDLKARLRSGLLSLEDRDLSSQGHLSIKMLIDKLQTAQQAGMFVRELAAGLDKCGRSAANNRVLLLSYLLVTKGYLSPVRAMPQAMPSLVAFLQRQHHSTNQDDLSTLGNRLGQALATVLSGDAAQQGVAVSQWGDTHQLSDRRSSLGTADSAGAGSAGNGGAPFLPDPPWVLNHVILPLLRVACRGPERDAMAAACAVLVPLVDTLGQQAARGGRSAQGPAAAVLQRLLGWAFTLLGSVATPLRSAGMLQLLASCAQALGPSLEVDTAKRVLLAATSGLDCSEDWQVRREAANLIRVLAGLALSPEAARTASGLGGEVESGGGAATWIAGPHRREFLLQALEPIRHDKFPAVRAAFQAAAAAVVMLLSTPTEEPATLAAAGSRGSPEGDDAFDRARHQGPPALPQQQRHSAAPAVRQSLRASRTAHQRDSYSDAGTAAAAPRGSHPAWRGDEADSRQPDQRGGDDGDDTWQWDHPLSREPSFSGMTLLSAGAESLARRAANVWQGAAAAAMASDEALFGRPVTRSSAWMPGTGQEDQVEEEGQDLALPPQPRQGGPGLRPQRVSEPVQRGRHPPSPLAGRRSAPEPGSRAAVAAVAAAGRPYDSRGGFNAPGSDEGGDEFGFREDWAAGGRSGAAAAARTKIGLSSALPSGTAAASASPLRSGSVRGSAGPGGSRGSAAPPWPPRDPDEDLLGGGGGGGVGSRAFSFAGSGNARDDGGDTRDAVQDGLYDGRARRPSWHMPEGGADGDMAGGRRAHGLSPGRDGRRSAAYELRYSDHPDQELAGWEGDDDDLARVVRSGNYGGARPAPSAVGGADMPTLLPSRSPRVRPGDSRTPSRPEEPLRHRPPSRSRPATAGAPSQTRAQSSAPLRQASPTAARQQQQQHPARPPWRCPSRGPSPRRPRSSSPGAGEGQPTAPLGGPRASSPLRSDLPAAGHAPSRLGGGEAGWGWSGGPPPPAWLAGEAAGGAGGGAVPCGPAGGGAAFAGGRSDDRGAGEPSRRESPPASRRPESAPARGVAARTGAGGAGGRAEGASGAQPVASSPLRRFQRRDTSRVSLGWPSGYRPPRSSPRFRRPAGLPPQPDFGVQVFAKDPPPPTQLASPGRAGHPDPVSGGGVGGGAGAAEPLYRVEVRTAGEEVTALVQVATPASPVAGRRPEAGGGARPHEHDYYGFDAFDRDRDGRGYPSHRSPGGHPGLVGAGAPAPVPGAAAAALAAGAAAAAAAGGMGYAAPSLQQQEQQPHLNARVHFLSGQALAGLEPAGGAAWSSEDGGESTSGAGGSSGQWGGAPRGSAAMEHQLQALVEQAQALQASLVRLGRQEPSAPRRQRRRWDSQHPATVWTDPGAALGGRGSGAPPPPPPPPPPGPAPGVDSLAVSAAVQQLQMLLQQAAGAQASLQLLLAGAGTPAALHGAVQRLEELVTALQQTDTGAGRGAGDGGGGGGNAAAQAVETFLNAAPHASARGVSHGPHPGDLDLPRDPRVQMDATPGSVFGPDTTGALQDLIRQVEATRQSISRVAQRETSPRDNSGPRVDSPRSPHGPASGVLSQGRNLAQTIHSLRTTIPDGSTAMAPHFDQDEEPPLSQALRPHTVALGLPSMSSPWATAAPEALRAAAAPGRRTGLSGGPSESGHQIGGAPSHTAGGPGSAIDAAGPAGSTSPRVRFSVPRVDGRGREPPLSSQMTSGHEAETRTQRPETGLSGIHPALTGTHNDAISGATAVTSNALDRAGRGITAALSSLIQRTESLRVPGQPSAPPPPRPAPAATATGSSRPQHSGTGDVGPSSRQPQRQQSQLANSIGAGGSWADGVSLSSLGRPAASRDSSKAGRGFPAAARSAQGGFSSPPSYVPPRQMSELAEDEAGWQHGGPPSRSHRYSRSSPHKGQPYDSQWDHDRRQGLPGTGVDAAAQGLIGWRSGTSSKTASARTGQLSAAVAGSSFASMSSAAAAAAAGPSPSWGTSPPRAASEEGGPGPPHSQHVPRIIDFRPLLPVATLRPHVVSPAGSPGESAAGLSSATGAGGLFPNRSSPSPIQAAMSRLHNLGAALAHLDGRQPQQHDSPDAASSGGVLRQPAVALQRLPPALPESPPRQPQPLYPMAVVPRQPRYPAGADDDALLDTGAMLEVSFSTAAPAAGSRSASPSMKTVVGREVSHLTVTAPPVATSTQAALNTTTAAAAQAAARLAALDISDTATSRPARVEVAVQTAAVGAAASTSRAGVTAITGRRDVWSPHRLSVASAAVGSPPDTSGHRAGLLLSRARTGSPVVTAAPGDDSPTRSVGSALSRLLVGGVSGSPPVLALGSTRTSSSHDAALLSSLDLAVQEPLVLDINTASEEGLDAENDAAAAAAAGGLSVAPSPRNTFRPLFAASGVASPRRPASPAAGPSVVADGAAYAAPTVAMHPDSRRAAALDRGPSDTGMQDTQVIRPAVATAGTRTSTGDLVAMASLTELENAAARAAALNRMLSTPVCYTAGESRQQLQQHASAGPLDSDGEELVAYPLPTLAIPSPQPASPVPGNDLASMFPATAAALARHGVRSNAEEAGTLRSLPALRDDTQRVSYAGFGAMPTPRAGRSVQDGRDTVMPSGGGQAPAWPPLMPSPDPEVAVPRKQMPRVLRPENLQALRDSATGLARSSIEAVREVEELVVRLTLLQQHLARRRTADGVSHPQELPGAGAVRPDEMIQYGAAEEEGEEAFELPLLHEL